MESAEAWICNGYALDIRFLADAMDGGAAKIWEAALALNPLPPERDLQFQHVVAGFTVGQIQRNGVKKDSLVRSLADASRGQLPLANCSLDLPRDQAPDFYSEMSHRDAWFSPIHLRVAGARRPLPSSLALARLDNALRSATPPFDGLQDVCAWLGLEAPGSSPNPPSLTIRIAPPVDLITDRCQLVEDELSLVIHAHPRFDVGAVRLAVRAVPGPGDLSARLHVAYAIAWGRARNGRREGVVRVRLPKADQALAFLMISDSTVRRQWFIDRSRARNNRFLAVQHFDRDLRMARSALLESPDASKFESGVALLLFLLGFTPALQIETNAPDLVVTTPGGRMALIECTTRVADLPDGQSKFPHLWPPQIPQARPVGL